MAGRKSKYTPEIIKEIIQVISVGGTDKDAYLLAGVDHDTFYEWMKRPEFSEQITRARAQSKIARIARIRKHADKDWRADAWYLERRYPEEYAQHLIVKLTSEQAAILKKANLTPDDAVSQFIEMIRQAQEADVNHDAD